VVDAGQLLDRSGRELAAMLHSERILEASIGMATFNALLEVDRTPLVEINAADLLLEQGAGKCIAVVGHFPFIERLRAAAKECWVLEQSPGPGDLPADKAAEVLPEADIVALTGTSLLNHTFDDLMALCRSDAFVLLLGPSVPMAPVLFEAGINALSGTLVDDPEQVMMSLSQGATFRQIKRGGGLRLLTWVK
jgi:hypothetical protein